MRWAFVISFLLFLPSIGLAEKPGHEAIVLTDEAIALHEDSLVIDGHNDLMWEVRKKGNSDFAQLDISQPQPRIHTDIQRLRRGNVGAQFWSVWVPVSKGKDGTAFLTTLEQIQLVNEMVATYPETFELALSTADIHRIQQDGKIASLIGVEGGHCIQESIGNLNQLYREGARYMTLTHSDSLSWADSSTDAPQSGGLSPFGEQVIEQMNRLGMMVDLSHVSVETMKAAMDVSKAPVIFSHSSARTIANTPRNVPDDVLRRIRETEGVVMVNFYSSFVVPSSAIRYTKRKALQRDLSTRFGPAETKARMARWDREHPLEQGDIHHVLDHIDHLVQVAGWQHVGLGADYDGVDTLPIGLEDVSRYPYITQGLLDRGYTHQQIKAILGGNLIRVMKKVEQVAQDLRSPALNP